MLEGFIGGGMSFSSATSVSFSLSPSCSTRCTSTNGSVGKPSRSDATSIHHTSPFFALNSNVSTSAAGKKPPAMSQGKVIFCACAWALFGSASLDFAMPKSAAGPHEKELTERVLA